MTARLISIEGIRGSGKSGLAAWLAEQLEASGIRVVRTKEPGGREGDATGQAIRSVLLDRGHAFEPMAETFGFEFDRARTYEAFVRPALERGEWVISDRHHFGTIAYQGFGRGVDLAWIDELSAHALGGRYPDLVLLLDLTVEESLRRRVSRGLDDRFEDETRVFESRAREGFLWAAARYGDRCVVIDATAPIETVRERALAVIRQRLPRQT